MAMQSKTFFDQLLDFAQEVLKLKVDNSNLRVVNKVLLFKLQKCKKKLVEANAKIKPKKKKKKKGVRQ